MHYLSTVSGVLFVVAFLPYVIAILRRDVQPVVFLAIETAMMIILIVRRYLIPPVL